MAEAQLSTREKVIGWAIEQGVSTVLLLLLCVGLWCGIPWARQCVKEDMAQIHEAHDKQVERVVNAFSEDQRRDEESSKADRDLIMKLLSERPLEKKQLAERP